MRNYFTLFLGFFVCSVAYVSAGFSENTSTPVWPISGSEADLKSPRHIGYSGQRPAPNSAPPTHGWSGGASYSSSNEKPVFSGGLYANDEAKMPLSTVTLMHDDGIHTLAASNPPGYPRLKSRHNQNFSLTQIEEASPEKTYVPDMVREWIARDGQNLRETLEEWAVLEGWEVVWTTDREYPLQASAVFKGRFTDVSSALIRTFGRAAPPPYAKFYYGNRVLVVKTLEDENAD